jgi:micrococcal nuclease
VPLVPYDLDCPDIPEADFYSVGSDPHGFDGDYDGLACESY